MVTENKKIERIATTIFHFSMNLFSLTVSHNYVEHVILQWRVMLCILVSV
jgi:hypothetical protein